MKTARQCINELLGLETVKVWSLIVTLFGDLGRKSAASLTGKEIREQLGHIGIKPEAIRVALHRLKKDGWIVTAKDGRETIYRLSEEGIHQTISAYKDVYRKDVKYGSGWKLQIQQEENPNDDRPQLPVFKNVAWVPASIDANHNRALTVEYDPTSLPDWFIERTVPGNVINNVQKYHLAIEQLADVLENCNEEDKRAIRLLALHHWRKMALRDNTWFHIWLFKDGVFAKCHRKITHILDA